ncbi:hypothetical protein TRIP_C21258 [Candidatus Zixiibacteriota bacterium]|nr:hypothetical protein TRIP_C21258 [candidate division Zixibacteria bacterium]
MRRISPRIEGGFRAAFFVSIFQKYSNLDIISLPEFMVILND